MATVEPSPSIEVVVVDDDESLRITLERLFGLDGHLVHHAGSADEALALVTDVDPDLVLLDLGLPGGRDGVDLLPELRRATEAGIIVLSGRDSEADRVLALRLEADDYVVKPFSIAELLARCESVVRRVRRARQVGDDVLADRVVDGDVVIDSRSREVWVGGEPVELRSKEFDLLAFLVRSPNRVFTRAQLLEDVWQARDGWLSEATVTEHVRRLRSKIEPGAGDDGRIRTVRGVGYRFVPEAQLSGVNQR